jgi:hypothetical protein
MMKRFVLALAFSGCASTLPATSTSITTAGRQAQLCLDDGAPRAGQPLRVQRNVCRRDEHAPDRVVCALEPIGTGEVVRALDKRCAVVRIASDVTVGRGDVIELADAPTPTVGAGALASRAQ